MCYCLMCCKINKKNKEASQRRLFFKDYIEFSLWRRVRACFYIARLALYMSMTYRRNFPMVMETMEKSRLALMKPSIMVMAEPMIGRNAKKPIHAPWPAMNRLAFSRFSFLTCRYFSTQSSRPSLPTL